ncbi:MAG: hypothetical protein AB7O48_08380 [Cyclobacteriaceae bacterium]
MKSKIFLSLAGPFILGTIFYWSSYDRGNSAHTEKQKGVCWVGGRNAIEKSDLNSLTQNSIEWISQTPFGWQSSADSPIIKMNTNSEHAWWGESDQGIGETARMAREMGIKSVLKPHLWVRNGWPGDIEMKYEENWQQWFDNYSKFILHYAHLAQQNQIEILCIGTELKGTIQHDEQWRSIIKSVRKIYTGKLTYGANFHEEYDRIKFWDALDFIGIQAYFPLSKVNKPGVDELSENWIEHVQEIEVVQRKFNKPVIFTEIGYRSTEDAAIEPWKWPQENMNSSVCEITQAACYQAFFDTVWKKDWLAGAYFWKWYPQKSSRFHQIDFTPQGKEAERILSKNYSK